MKHSFTSLLLVGLTLAAASPQNAMAADTSGAAQPQGVQQSVVTQRVVTVPSEVQKPAGQRPIFRLFGLPVVIGAPVAPPYAPSAYRDLGGQPESGRDAIMAQSMPTD